MKTKIPFEHRIACAWRSAAILGRAPQAQIRDRAPRRLFPAARPTVGNALTARPVADTFWRGSTRMAGVGRQAAQRPTPMITATRLPKANRAVQKKWSGPRQPRSRQSWAGARRDTEALTGFLAQDKIPDLSGVLLAASPHRSRRASAARPRAPRPTISSYYGAGAISELAAPRC